MEIVATPAVGSVTDIRQKFYEEPEPEEWIDRQRFELEALTRIGLIWTYDDKTVLRDVCCYEAGPFAEPGSNGGPMLVRVLVTSVDLSLILQLALDHERLGENARKVVAELTDEGLTPCLPITPPVEA